MKTVFIPAKQKQDLDLSLIKHISKELPKNIAIAYSIQFETQAKQIRIFLSKQHNIISFLQVLGCSKPRFSKNIQAILLLSSGRFHGVSLAFETNIPVFLLENNNLIKISEKEIDLLKQKQKASYVNYLNSKKIGILISTKPGQSNLSKAIKIKDKLQKSQKNKEFYLFLSNNINTNEFDNFPEITSWLNTACKRLDLNDIRIFNSESLG